MARAETAAATRRTVLRAASELLDEGELALLPCGAHGIAGTNLGGRLDKGAGWVAAEQLVRRRVDAIRRPTSIKASQAAGEKGGSLGKRRSRRKGGVS